MPRCAWCKGDTEWNSRYVEDGVSQRWVHTETGEPYCDKSKELPVSVERYRLVSGNVHEVTNDRVGKFVGTLEDIADVFVLHKDAAEVEPS